MNRKSTVTGANKLLFIFTLLFMVFQFILVFLTLIYGQDFINNNVYEILLVTQYLIILVPVILYIIFNRLDAKIVLRINNLPLLPSGLIVLMSIPAYFAAAMLNSVVVYFLQRIGDIPAQPIPVPQNFPELVIGILVIALTPAICEEALHRGIMLGAYERRGSMKAIAISAVLFGLFHFDITNLAGPVFLGLLIGYYVVRTNSIFAGVLAHFLNNATAEFLQYFTKDMDIPEGMVVSDKELISVIILGALCLLVLGGLIALFRIATVKTAVIEPSISSIKNDIKSVLSHWPVIVIITVYVFMTGMFILSMLVT
jgi:uncharacterized protein